ncbi:acyltransferase [Coralloluteibacterium stylophorae]|uniref:Acyltransferase n=1 Tax=Coralloluteibacterium stylophorae TaxID=1776034 RepID=A0A8J7VVB4_9GAMM|nr:acyltransferase [Coralloluteibacterium stylophorae]
MSAHWSQRPEGGGRFALWLIRGIGLHGGRRIARLLLRPITLYFLLVRGPERRASRAYLTRVLGRPASLWHVARHIHTFAATILDRVFLLSGRDEALDIRVHGLDALHACMDRGRGVLLFGSHHGSFEALRALSQSRPDVRVRVVLDRGQSPALTCLLDSLNPGIARTVIDAGQPGTAIVLAIGEAAAEGALIGLLADRARPGEKALQVPFLGTPAPFPVAPALIAATLGIPVVLCFGLFRGGNRYDLHFEHFADALTIPRRERAATLEAVLARYAARLEHYVRLAPYNWFNFYDFWRTDDDPAPAHADRDPAVDAGAADAAALGARRA